MRFVCIELGCICQNYQKYLLLLSLWHGRHVHDEWPSDALLVF